MRFVKRELMVIALMVAFLFVASLSEAAPADPGGAYGLLWGDSPKTANEKIKKLGWEVEKSDKDQFPRATGIMGPAESKIDCVARVENYPAKVRLRFFNDHLFSIIVDYKQRDDVRDARLGELFTSKYRDIPKGAYPRSWVVGDTQIVFTKTEAPETQGFYSCIFHEQMSASRKVTAAWLEHLRKPKK